MKIIKDEKLIKRNGQIGNWTSIAALAVLGTGMYLSFKRPDLFIYSIGALILGFTLTQIGMSFSSRFGRSPRPDEQLDAGLKGLPNDDCLYHFMTPAAHLYVGSAGIWVLATYHQRGRVVYQKNRWRLTGGGFLQAYMTVFGQEGLGRPEMEMTREINGVKNLLSKKMGDADLPEVNGALVFTNEGIEIEGSTAPQPAVQLKKLKDFLRQKAKDQPLSSLKMMAVKAALPSGE